MPTYSGQPIIRKITSTGATGKVSIAYSQFATSWIQTLEKTTQVEPPYVPGNFLVKDYYVRESLSRGEAEVLTHQWTRYDGATFKDEYFMSGYCYTSMLSLATEAVPDVGALKALSLQQAYSKLNRATWDSLVDLAEIGGTFDLIKGGLKLLSSPKHIPHLLESMLNYLNDTKSTKRTIKRIKDLSWSDVREAAKNGSKRAADLWLLFRYGIMPAIYSIQDALELLKKKLAKAGKQIRTVRRRPGEVKSTTTRRIVSPKCTIVTEWKSKVEAIVFYKQKADATMQQALGLVPENLPNAFWETCKLSFVWDWFFNVGDFLSALKPKFGIETLGSTVSERHTGTISVVQQFVTLQVGVYVSAKPYVLTHNSFKRTANPAMSFTPVFTGLDGMNLDRYKDAAALALQPILNSSRKAKKALR